MTDSNTTTQPEGGTTLGHDLQALLRHWLGGRRGLIVLGLAAAGVGLWLGWSSLVAAGIAPLLLGVLPCVAMCALGLCMRRDGGPSHRPHERGGETTTSASDVEDSGHNP